MDLTMPSNPLDSWWPYIISIIIGLITCIRGFMGGTQCPTSNRMDGKIVIITGASSGTGFETSKEIAARGAHVIMGCRSIQKGIEAMKLIKHKLPNAILTLKKLDLASTKSIKNFVESIGNHQVDVLINNAGIIFHPFSKTEDGFEMHLGTNYVGHFLLTHLLMNNLKHSKQGRIINVCAGSYQPVNMPLSCDPVKENYVPKEWFEQSKLALILMTKYIAKLTKGTQVTINALNPGMVRSTQHLRHSILMKKWNIRIILAPWMWLFMKSPNQGAQTSIFLATDPALDNISGKFFSNCCEEEILGKGNDMKEAKLLFEKTCELLDIKSVKE